MIEKIFSFLSHRIMALTGASECVLRCCGRRWQRGKDVKDNGRVLIT